jgi:hypothetical protein
VSLTEIPETSTQTAGASSRMRSVVGRANT